MPILANLRARLTGGSVQPVSRQSMASDPLILELDGNGQLSVLSGKSLTTAADASAWRRSGSGFREIPANEMGYAQAYCAVVWLQRAADIRANKISEMLHKGQVVDKATGEVIENHPLMAAFERSRREYHHDLFRQWEYWRILTGEAFIEPVKGAVPGMPFLETMFGFRVLNSLVTQVNVQRGQILGFDYAGDDRIDHYGPDELVYDYTFNPFNDNRGKSMLSAVLDDMNIQRGVLVASRNYVKNGLHSRVVFVAKNQTLTQPEMDQLLAALKDQASGPQNAGRPLVLPPALEATVLTPAAPAEQRVYKQDAQQAAATATGVPLPLIVYEQNPYQLSPEQRIGWYDNSLIPAALDMAYIVDTMLLPYFDSSSTHQFRMPIDDIRANLIDPKERAEMVRTKLHGGWITFNQALQAEGKTAVEGGDFYLFPSGMVAVPENQLAQINELTRQPQPMALQAVPQPVERPSTPAQLPAGQPALRSVDPDVVDSQIVPEPPFFVSDAMDELARWQKFLHNGTHTKRAFIPRQIPPDIAEGLQAAIDSGDSMKTGSAFDEARALLQEASLIQYDYSLMRLVKAYVDTRAQFVDEMVRVIGAAQKDESTRRGFAGAMRSALRRYGLIAFRDGMNEVGYDPESLGSDELRSFREWQAEQSGYVTNLGAEIFKQGITETQVRHRAMMWADVSLNDARLRGIEVGKPNQMLEWFLGMAEEHCSHCPRLAGTVLPAKEWRQLRLRPGSGHTECKQGCKCSLRVTNKPRQGDVSWLVGSA